MKARIPEPLMENWPFLSAGQNFPWQMAVLNRFPDRHLSSK